MSMYTTSMCVIKKHQNELDKAFSLYKMTINVLMIICFSCQLIGLLGVMILISIASSAERTKRG